MTEITNYSVQLVIDVSLQCFDTVGWATGRASGLKKLGVGLLVVMICLELWKMSCPVPQQPGKRPLKWGERESL